MLLPHVKEVIQFTVEFDKDDQLNKMRIAGRYGWYLSLMGKYEEAEAIHRRALIGYEKVREFDAEADFACSGSFPGHCSNPGGSTS
jgi:hypothetical protein